MRAVGVKIKNKQGMKADNKYLAYSIKLYNQ